MNATMLLILFSALILLSTTSYAKPVLDIDGSALLPGTQYYILPFIRGMGGGLTMASRNDLCPLYVAQEDMEVASGLPLWFLPANTNATTVEIRADVNVQFTAITICINSNVWQLSSGTDSTRYIRTDGDVGNPGRSTLPNWFNFDDSELAVDGVYEIVFCPSVCSYCRPECGKIGVFHEEYKSWLGFGGQFFPVRFKKA